MAETLDPRALCSLADVKRLIPGMDADDESLDDELTRIVNSETRAIFGEASREFVGPAEPETRVFPVDRDVVSERELETGDIAADTDLVVELKLADGTLVETVDPDAIVLLPRNRWSDWDPFTSIEFTRGLQTSSVLAVDQLAHVTASWGFPAVPADIREACAYRVISKGLVDLARVSSAFEEATAGADISRGLAAGFRAVHSYRINTVA